MSRSSAASTMLAVLGSRQRARVGHVRQALDGPGHVEGFVLDGGHDQIAGGGEGGAGDVFPPGADHHLIDAATTAVPGFAEAVGQAGQVLQLQVTCSRIWPGQVPSCTSAQKAAALFVAAAVLDERRQPGREPFVESGDGVGGEPPGRGCRSVPEDRAIGPYWDR